MMNIRCNVCDRCIEITEDMCTDMYMGEANGVQIIGIDGCKCLNCGTLHDIGFSLIYSNDYRDDEDEEEDNEEEEEWDIPW